MQCSCCTITHGSLGGNDKCQWPIDKPGLADLVCISFYPSLVKHWSISRNQVLSQSHLLFHSLVSSLQHTLCKHQNLPLPSLWFSLFHSYFSFPIFGGWSSSFLFITPVTSCEPVLWPFALASSESQSCQYQCLATFKVVSESKDKKWPLV